MVPVCQIGERGGQKLFGQCSCERATFQTDMLVDRITFDPKGRVWLPNRMIFWKSAKGGEGHLQSKKLYCRFWKL